MKKRAIPTEDEIKAIRVTLPVLFGRQPREYIVALWAIVIGVVLFLVLILPGLLFPGSHVRIESDAASSSVRVDGVRLGTTPLDVFLPAGKHQVEVVAPGLTAAPQTVDLPRHVVGSLIVLGRTTIHFDQTLPTPQDFLAATVREFSRWSLADTNSQDLPRKSYPIPPVLAPAIETYLSILKDKPVDAALLLNLMQAATVQVNNQSQAEDWAKAWEILGNRLKIKDATTQTAVDWFASLADVNGNTNAGPFMELVLPGNPKIPRSAAVPTIGAANFGGDLSFGSLTFRSFTVGSTAGYLALRETDEASWGEFLKAHPEWSVEARSSLQAQGLVDGNYLKIWADDLAKRDLPSNKPVREVSYAAAEQFAKWFTENNLPAALKAAGFKATLPSRNLWLALDKVSSPSAWGPWLTKGQDFPVDYRSSFGSLNALRGGLFEWSSDTAAYHVSSRPDIQEAVRQFPGFQRQVLGGGVTMAEAEFDPQAVYGQPGDWCSPYLGFRLVVVKE